MGTAKNTNFVFRPNCEICGSKNSEIIYDSDFGEGPTWYFLEQYYKKRIEKSILRGGSYTLKICTECGFIWQSQTLNDQLTKVLYEQWISPDESLEKERCRVPVTAREFSYEVGLIQDLLYKQKPEEMCVLDFGMGWGSWCLAAIDRGYEVYGLELSEPRIEFAQSEGIKVIKGLDDAPKNFDYINSEQVFEHIRDPKSLLKELTTRLNSGGIIRIAVPNGLKFKRAYRRNKWFPGKDAVHPLEHINCFDHKSLLCLAESVCLQPISTSRFLRAHMLVLANWESGNFHWTIKNFLKHFVFTGIYFEKP